MKTAKSFVRRVRSKSPFRRRKRAETLVAEVREKEQAYLRQLNQTSQPDDQAEIEVVLESSSSDYANVRAEPAKTPPRKENAVPELASSSASTDEPPAQAAARRFMERQQRLAAGNRRKSFRDRFMRPAKNNSAPPPPPSPAKSTKQMGISVRGRNRSKSSASSLGRGRVTKPRERGRSKERSIRGGLGRGSSAKSKPSRSNSRNRGFTALIDDEDLDKPGDNQEEETKGTVEKPGAISVGMQSRVSELSTPAAIIRQESLGTESIRDVRQALQKMELDLAAAGDAGKRVSRDKIMSALNYMAHSLHYDDQKEALTKELDEWIEESVIAGGTNGRRVYTDDEDDEESDDDTSYSDDTSGSTFELDAFDGRSRISSRMQLQSHQSSFQDLFVRLGKFFSITEEDKTAVRQALEDLLWMEVVGDTPATSTRHSSRHDDETMFSNDSIGNFDPLTCSIQDPKKEPLAPTRGRSWWRHHGNASSSTKKENLYPVKERPPSPESKISVPSPTGKVNPRPRARPSKTKGSGKSSSKSGSHGKSPGSAKPSRQPSRTNALKERAPPPKSRFKMDESDTSGWSSFDETSSEFWREGDRYTTIPSKPKASSTQHAQVVNHYKLSYPHSYAQFSPDNDPFFDLESPKEEDEFGDWNNGHHPAENMDHRRQVM